MIKALRIERATPATALTPTTALTGGLQFALEPGLAVGMRFQLGLALEAAGRSQEALVEFEQLFDIQPSYPDVAQKIRTLRRSLEAA